MKPSNLNRRRFLKRLGLIGASGLLLTAADGKLVEPQWLKIRRVRIGTGTPVCRFAYFTDLHYKGDWEYAQSVVDHINALEPDFVCFGGDLMENKKYVPEALDLLSGIKAPLYGVPGNHDYSSGANFRPYHETFNARGGAWLMDGFRDLMDGRVRLIGLVCCHFYYTPLPVNPAAKNIVLMHYPAWADRFDDQRFDLILAGHSHGGQVRLPLIGSLVVPWNVGRYDMGQFETKSGPLYVNPGIGWLSLNIRINCRPEITVFEV